MFQTKFVEKIKKNLIFNDCFEKLCVCEIMCRNMVQPQTTDENMAPCALHAGYLKLQPQTKNM